MGFDDDEKPPPDNRGSNRGLVRAKPCMYSKPYTALTADTVTAEIEIYATTSTTVREGLDLVAVLDVSGRMHGKKMDDMKKAMLFVIMKLTPVDRLSIVTFSDNATRLCPLRSMTPAAQVDLKALVNDLQANGAPNIKAGLETGLAVIADRTNTVARAANIFLLSDGHQTSGDARQVNPGKVSIYTFGFGRGTDHRLMSDIAKISPSGTYSTTRNDHRSFSQVLARLLTVVAQDVHLFLTPNTDFEDVDTIVVPPSANYSQDTDAATGVVTIKFGTLSAGEGHRVIITITLKDSPYKSEKEEYDTVLAEAQHSFTAQRRQDDPQLPQDIEILRRPTTSPEPSRWKLDAEIDWRQSDAIRQVRVLADGKDIKEAQDKGLSDLLNKLVDELQQLTAHVYTHDSMTPTPSKPRRRPEAPKPPTIRL